ncbi:hypothetical protein U1Q18_005702 [Sarracenia purpurea var. burkii]
MAVSTNLYWAKAIGMGLNNENLQNLKEYEKFDKRTMGKADSDQTLEQEQNTWRRWKELARMLSQALEKQEIIGKKKRLAEKDLATRVFCGPTPQDAKTPQENETSHFKKVTCVGITQNIGRQWKILVDMCRDFNEVLDGSEH